MAQAARNIERSYNRSAASARRPELEVRTTPELSWTALPIFRCVIVLIIAVAVVCGIRVWFTAATAQAVIASDEVEIALEEAYTTGSDLEVQASTLVKPSRIQSGAEKLGMTIGGSASFIDGESVIADYSTPSTLSEALTKIGSSSK